jgi:hypothetical protein
MPESACPYWAEKPLVTRVASRIALHRHAVEHEDLLPGPAAANGRLHHSRLESDGLIETGDGKLPQVRRGDLLYSGGNAGIE